MNEVSVSKPEITTDFEQRLADFQSELDSARNILDRILNHDLNHLATLFDGTDDSISGITRYRKYLTFIIPLKLVGFHPWSEYAQQVKELFVSTSNSLTLESNATKMVGARHTQDVSAELRNMLERWDLIDDVISAYVNNMNNREGFVAKLMDLLINKFPPGEEMVGSNPAVINEETKSELTRLCATIWNTITDSRYQYPASKPSLHDRNVALLKSLGPASQYSPEIKTLIDESSLSMPDIEIMIRPIQEYVDILEKLIAFLKTPTVHTFSDLNSMQITAEHIAQVASLTNGARIKFLIEGQRQTLIGGSQAIAVFNLLINAFRHSPKQKKGEYEVKLNINGNGMIVVTNSAEADIISSINAASGADDGRPPGRNKIFELGAKRGQSAGQGIGLWLAHRLLLLDGLDLSVEADETSGTVSFAMSPSSI